MTWTSVEPDSTHQWLGPELLKSIPEARVLLYDHLTPEERGVADHDSEDDRPETSNQACEGVKSRVAKYGIADWSKRLLETLEPMRDTQAVFSHFPSYRPKLIAHSSENDKLSSFHIALVASS